MVEVAPFLLRSVRRQGTKPHLLRGAAKEGRDEGVQWIVAGARRGATWCMKSKGGTMKTIIALIAFLSLSSAALAQYGTYRPDPLAITPTWRGPDSSGGAIIMRENPLGITPSYDLRGSGGYRGRVQQDPLGITPTYRGRDSNGNDIQMRERPLGISPAYDLSI